MKSNFDKMYEEIGYIKKEASEEDEDELLLLDVVSSHAVKSNIKTRKVSTEIFIGGLFFFITTNYAIFLSGKRKSQSVF